MISLARPQAPFGRRELVVTSRREVGPYVALTALDAAGPAPLAGQFYMLSTPAGWGGGEDGRPYLPRALSFARCAEASSGVSLDFLFEVVGPGTDRLAQVPEGEVLEVNGPFGNGFTPDGGREAILVAGGIGLAPIVALDDQFRASDVAPAATLVGMRSAQHAEACALYDLECELATDDGSAGRKAFVTELLSDQLRSHPAAEVFACGPPLMLEAVRELCGSLSVPAQLAMESGMACGFGACHGCVVPTRSGYLRLCVDGPVLAAAEIDSAAFSGAES